MNWIFTDREDAVEGVKSGTYYAAIIIPADFSEKMFSFLSPGGEAPELEYYVNEKKNAIAPKVVGKEAGNLTDWVQETFTRTLYDTVFDSLLTFKEDGKMPTPMPFGVVSNSNLVKAARHWALRPTLCAPLSN